MIGSIATSLASKHGPDVSMALCTGIGTVERHGGRTGASSADRINDHADDGGFALIGEAVCGAPVVIMETTQSRFSVAFCRDPGDAGGGQSGSSLSVLYIVQWSKSAGNAAAPFSAGSTSCVQGLPSFSSASLNEHRLLK